MELRWIKWLLTAATAGAVADAPAVAAVTAFCSVAVALAVAAGIPIARGWNVLEAEILVWAIAVDGWFVVEACSPRKPLIFSPMPHVLDGDADEAGMPDCCAVRAEV